MRTRIDVDDYQAATADQRAEVDAYVAALDRPNERYGILALEATAEGTVRVERLLTGPGWGWIVTYETCQHCGRWDLSYVKVHETLRSPVPPPWLAWPDTEEGDPDA